MPCESQLKKKACTYLVYSALSVKKFCLNKYRIY